MGVNRIESNRIESKFAANRIESNRNFFSRIAHLYMVFVALIISRITYALPAWSGFLSAVLISKLDSLLSRALRWGYTAKAHSLKDIQKEV